MNIEREKKLQELSSLGRKLTSSESILFNLMWENKKQKEDSLRRKGEESKTY